MDSVILMGGKKWFYKVLFRICGCCCFFHPRAGDVYYCRFACIRTEGCTSQQGRWQLCHAWLHTFLRRCGGTGGDDALFCQWCSSVCNINRFLSGFEIKQTAVKLSFLLIWPVMEKKSGDYLDKCIRPPPFSTFAWLKVHNNLSHLLKSRSDNIETAR